MLEKDQTTPQPRRRRRTPTPAPAPSATPLAPGEAGLTAAEVAFVNSMLAWYERAGAPRDPAAEERIRVAVATRVPSVTATAEP